MGGPKGLLLDFQGSRHVVTSRDKITGPVKRAVIRATGGTPAGGIDVRC